MLLPPSPDVCIHRPPVSYLCNKRLFECSEPIRQMRRVVSHFANIKNEYGHQTENNTRSHTHTRKQKTLYPISYYFVHLFLAGYICVCVCMCSRCNTVSPMIFVPNQLVGAPSGTDVAIDCNTEAHPKYIKNPFLYKILCLFCHALCHDRFSFFYIFMCRASSVCSTYQGIHVRW